MEQDKLKKSFASLEEMAEYIEKEGVDIVDACFVDPMGTWNHCSYAPSQCKLEDLKDGFAFDGSSIRLFTTVDKSDMQMKPVPSSCWIDPFSKTLKTLHVTCYIEDPFGNSFDRCPRGIAMRAVEYAKGTADEIFFGPEPEFFIFDDVKFAVKDNKAMWEVDGSEGFWQSGEDKRPNLGHRGLPKSYYFPVAPQDAEMDLRGEMLATMARVGVPVEKHHHEVALCQHELGFSCRDMLTTADNVMVYKYIVKNVAKEHGKSATFMPKPIGCENGSGMHCHQSLWKNGQNLFFDENGPYFKMSQVSLYYMGGLIKHASSVLAFSNPTVNSYKRLVPGFEAPSSLVFSKGNRSAAIRIPLSGGDRPKAKRLEFRCPDAACCPYIAFAAMLMAGLDGMANKIDPPPAMDRDMYELTPEDKAKISLTPASLEQALDALEADHEFLTRGGVFPESFIKSYITFKRAEAKSVHLTPTPKEYQLYYHC